MSSPQTTRTLNSPAAVNTLVFNGTDQESHTGSAADLKKWVSTITRKAWHRARHPFRPVINHRNSHKTNPHLPGQSDSGHSFGHCLNYKDLSLILAKIPALSDSSSHLRIAGCLSGRLNYLLHRENCSQDIIKLNNLLQMPQVLLEIGCGNAEAALQIARKNPGIGVIATDLYDWSDQQSDGSHYGQTAQSWRERQLPAQMDTPANLVVLRAEAGFLRYLPLRTIDTIFFINPEPHVGKLFFELFKKESLCLRIKENPIQIVILPHSRDLGVLACGGCSFDHDPDWSRGLGFFMDSGLCFRVGADVHWGVDLSLISAYSGNSTQKGIYVFGEQSDGSI